MLRSKYKFSIFLAPFVQDEPSVDQSVQRYARGRGVPLHIGSLITCGARSHRAGVRAPGPASALGPATMATCARACAVGTRSLGPDVESPTPCGACTRFILSARAAAAGFDDVAEHSLAAAAASAPASTTTATTATAAAASTGRGKRSCCEAAWTSSKAEGKSFARRPTSRRAASRSCSKRRPRRQRQRQCYGHGHGR
jgi:hypothetical protein